MRRRIRSVKNISQVTKAMEAVAASKMRRAQNQVLATRPYAKKAQEVLSYIARLNTTEGDLDALINERAEIKRVGILLVTADKGLAGGFNANVIRTAAQFIRKQRAEGKEVEVITVGRKGRDWLLRYDPVVRAEFMGLGDAPTTNDIAPITRILLDDYRSGRFDQVYAIYTDFVNTLVQQPVVQKLLPVQPAETDDSMAPDYIFEPSAGAVLNEVLIGFTEVQVLQAVYESSASEHSARMVAMRNATEAANELVDDLTLRYNKARQEGITRELMDIVGGSVVAE
ncbi:MAG: ATP synthase F1 subunit gamma [Caldilineaceae bacterium]|nr:ATP synthase F1 subunit gamma [Caldilineaceae bacterium]